MAEVLKNACSIQQVNAAIAETGRAASLLHNPNSVAPGLYFVNVGERYRAFKIVGVSSVSDRTIEEWIEELKVAECEVKLNDR